MIGFLTKPFQTDCTVDVFFLLANICQYSIILTLLLDYSARLQEDSLGIYKSYLRKL